MAADTLSQQRPDQAGELAFTCTHEQDRIPPRDPEANQLYKRARWLRKNNTLKKDPSVFPNVERLVRIATAYGHDKANLELRDLIERNQAVSATPITESVSSVVESHRCPTGRDHKGRQGPGQDKEDISYLARGVYMPKPGE